VGTLSWSSSQRLAIAQALVGRPRLLLLDDTLTALDGGVRRELASALCTLVADGLSIVVASDELAALEGVATRVAVMTAGRIMSFAEPRDLRQALALELTVAAPRARGSRVAEGARDCSVVRLALGDSSPEEILAHCRETGIDVRTSRIIRLDDGPAPGP
jgi:ABC-type multidrug transport system ATPase subunit